MSEIRVENIIGETGSAAVKFTKGINVTGIATATNVSVGSSVTAATYYGSGANLSGLSAGITMAQTWRITSNYDIPSSANQVISSNWEIADTYSYGGIGASMTESSGVFTFPSTGIYLIQFSGKHTCTGAANWSQTEIQVTSNNSNYFIAAYGYASLHNSGSWQSSYCQFMFDVTDTSTHKARFVAQGSNANTDLVGGTNQNQTAIFFIRLGDT